MSMPNCLNGYLTPECKDCPFWLDGSDEKGYGCGAPFPISHCPSFEDLMNEYEQKAKKGE